MARLRQTAAGRAAGVTSPYLNRRIRSLDEVLAPGAPSNASDGVPRPGPGKREPAPALQPATDAPATEDRAPS